MKLFILFQYFKGHLRGGAACFRLKVRDERLKAGSFYRFALNYFILYARGRGVAIVVIVALAVLVALWAARPRGFSVILGKYAEGRTDIGYSAK